AAATGRMGRDDRRRAALPRHRLVDRCLSGARHFSAGAGLLAGRRRPGQALAHCAMTAPPLLSVENLAVAFDTAHGPVPALQGVSFSLAQGEVLGIVGESGAGKTVACRSIMRLLAGNARILAGSIRFEGRDMLALDERELRRVRGERVAMIFQNPSTHL